MSVVRIGPPPDGVLPPGTVVPTRNRYAGRYQTLLDQQRAQGEYALGQVTHMGDQYAEQLHINDTITNELEQSQREVLNQQERVEEIRELALLTNLANAFNLLIINIHDHNNIRAGMIQDNRPMLQEANRNTQGFNEQYVAVLFSAHLRDNVNYTVPETGVRGILHDFTVRVVYVGNHDPMFPELKYYFTCTFNIRDNGRLMGQLNISNEEELRNNVQQRGLAGTYGRHQYYKMSSVLSHLYIFLYETVYMQTIRTAERMMQAQQH